MRGGQAAHRQPHLPFSLEYTRPSSGYCRCRKAASNASCETKRVSFDDAVSAVALSDGLGTVRVCHRLQATPLHSFEASRHFSHF